MNSNLINKSIICDMHSCMPLRADNSYMAELERFRNSGVTALSINVGFDGQPLSDIFYMLASMQQWIEGHNDHYCLISKSADITQAKREGKMAISFDLEGASALNGRLDMIGLYYKLGVRWMSLAYNQNNQVGGGCQDDDQGLTDFGKQVLLEMSRIGMIVCLSHTGEKTAHQAIEIHNQPIILSHSNPNTVFQHPRNASDSLMKLCAEKGGVIGINGVGFFLGNNDAGTENLIRHIDYSVQLMGIDHVGLGFDFVFDLKEANDYLQQHPEKYPAHLGYHNGVELVQPEQISEITEHLTKLGYKESDVQKIIGLNYLRIAETIWAQ